MKLDITQIEQEIIDLIIEREEGIEDETDVQIFLENHFGEKLNHLLNDMEKDRLLKNAVKDFTKKEYVLKKDK